MQRTPGDRPQQRGELHRAVQPADEGAAGAGLAAHVRTLRTPTVTMAYCSVGGNKSAGPASRDKRREVGLHLLFVHKWRLQAHNLAALLLEQHVTSA
jgi:hypothetical protein